METAALRWVAVCRLVDLGRQGLPCPLDRPISGGDRRGQEESVRTERSELRSSPLDPGGRRSYDAETLAARARRRVIRDDAGVSFELELGVPIEGWEVAERLAEATRDESYVTLVAGRGRRWFRSLAPSVQLDWSEAQAVLDDQASLWEDEFTLSERRHALAETLLVVAGELTTAEWTLRCCWVGDEIRSEACVTAAELADRVRRSSVNRYVLYRVSGDGSA
jgi:hypothetical protein